MSDQEDQVEEFSFIPQEVKEASEKAKAEGLTPYWLSINSYSFVYRPITRKEWKTITRDQNKEILEADEDLEKQLDIKNHYTELLVKNCLVYSDISVDESFGAGYVDTLFEAILVDSGFGQPDQPSIRL